MNSNKPKTVMGIDPGTNRAGYGVIEICGNAVKCVVLGDIELHKYKDPYVKLQHLFNRVSGLIESYAPDEVALESPFFGENVQSMLKLGRAQGVAMAAALSKDIPVFEYAPRRIKQAITGQGGASKEQVAALLKSILKIEYDVKRLDATDGLAVALCHHFVSSSPIPAATLKRGRATKSGGWESFLTANPDRAVKSASGGVKSASSGVKSANRAEMDVGMKPKPPNSAVKSVSGDVKSTNRVEKTMDVGMKPEPPNSAVKSASSGVKSINGVEKTMDVGMKPEPPNSAVKSVSSDVKSTNRAVKLKK